MSVRMSVGVIFWTGAVAASKSASNGSVIRSLKKLRFLRMGTIIDMSIISVSCGSGVFAGMHFAESCVTSGPCAFLFSVRLRYSSRISTRQARVLICHNFVNFTRAEP